MTEHVARLYAAAAAVLAFFLAWAGISAHPWAKAPQDPRVAALAQREARLQRDAKLVRQIVQSRRAASAQSRVAAAPPAVRVVTLPPVATSKSS